MVGTGFLVTSLPFLLPISRCLPSLRLIRKKRDSNPKKCAVSTPGRGRDNEVVHAQLCTSTLYPVIPFRVTWTELIGMTAASMINPYDHKQGTGDGEWGQEEANQGVSLLS